MLQARQRGKYFELLHLKPNDIDLDLFNVLRPPFWQNKKMEYLYC